MIPSANGKASGRRFFHSHVVFCNQGDKSGMPKYRKCVCTEMLSRAKRHSWNALLWCTLRCNHLTGTNLCGLQQPPSLYHWHSRSEIIQAQGQTVKHYHALLPAFFRESPTFCVFASLACQTRTLSELLTDKTSRSTGYPQRLLLFFSAHCCRLSLLHDLYLKTPASGDVR